MGSAIANGDFGAPISKVESHISIRLLFGILYRLVFSCRHGKLYGGVLTKPKIKRDSNHDENSRFALWSLGVTLKTARLPKDMGGVTYNSNLYELV